MGDRQPSGFALHLRKMPVVFSSPKLLDLLRSRLEKLESEPDFDSDDPAVAEFRRSLIRSIAELDVQKSDAA
jgi:hypothetical protein